VGGAGAFGGGNGLPGTFNTGNQAAGGGGGAGSGGNGGVGTAGTTSTGGAGGIIGSGGSAGGNGGGAIYTGAGSVGSVPGGGGGGSGNGALAGGAGGAGEIKLAYYPTATALQVQVPSSVTSGASFSVTVNAVDSQGNIITGATPTVTLANGTATGSYPAAHALASGTFTFTGVSLTAGGTITATATGLTGTSSSITVNTAPSAYTVTGGASLTAGGSETITVTALDPSGATLNYNGNLAVTFSGMHSSPSPATAPTIGGVAFSGGTATKTLTFSSGTASASLQVYDKESTTLSCSDGTASSTSGTGAASLSLTVSPTSLNKLAMATEPSGSVAAGAVLSTQPAVNLEDQYGNIETGNSSSTVTATVGTGTGPLTGTTTATAASGVATFSGLAAPTLAQPSGIKLTFTDSPDSLTSLADNTSITVTPAAASKLALSQGAGSVQTDGQTFTPSPVIDVEDQYGNVVTGDSSTVNATVLSHSGTGTLGGTVNQAASSGVATFSALNYALGSSTTAETVQVQYTDSENGGLTAVNNSSVTVNPNLTISFSAEPASTTAGATLASVVVNVVTTSGSVAVPDGTSVALSLVSGGTLNGTTTQTTVGGNATFSNLSINKDGTYTLKASVGLQSANEPNPFVISSGTYNQLQVLLPGETATPGVGTGKTGTASNAHLSTAYSITVNAVDTYYNVVSGAPANSVALTTSDSDSGTPAAAPLASGTVTFSFPPASLAPSGITVTANDATASTTGTSSTFDVFSQNPYYRSTVTANWSVAADWQVSTDDGTTWATSSVVPESTGNPADQVQITGSALTVTANTALTISNVTVTAGNTLSVTAALALGGTAPALDVHGVLTVATGGSIADNAASSGTGAGTISDLTTQSGTITTTTASKTVTGSGTSFTSALIGSPIYSSTGAPLGVVTAVAGGTSLTLSGNAGANVTAGAWQHFDGASALVGTGTSFSGTEPAGTIIITAGGLAVGAVSSVGSGTAVTLAGASQLPVSGSGWGYVIPTSGAGTITSTAGSTAVTGTGTSFTSALVGSTLYTTAGVQVGVVASVTDGTDLTLALPAFSGVSGAAWSYFLPHITVESNGSFSLTTVGGAVPLAAWIAGSTCTYAPASGGSAFPTGLSQTFGNFAWNWSTQSGSANLAGALAQAPAGIQGNFDITAGSTFDLTISGDDSTYTFVIGGTLKIHGASGKLAVAGGAPQGTYTFQIGGGIVFDGTGGAANISTIDWGNNTSGHSQDIVEFTGSSGIWNTNASVSPVGENVINNPQGVVSYTVENGATLTLQSPLEVTNVSGVYIGTLTVASGGTLNCGTSTNIWGPGAFTVASGGTLEIGSLAGITSSGATGNITCTGTRTFSTGGNYIYNGTSSQVLGNGLPATVNNLTLASGMTDSVTVVPPASPGGTASSDATVYNVAGTLTANSAVIGYTVGGSGKLIRGTYPIFDYGTLSGSFGTPTKVAGTQQNAPTVTTGSGVVALTVANNAPTATAVTSNEITGASIKIPVSSLIAAGTDFDGDTLTISAVDVTTADAQTITTNAATVFVPATANGDTFNYVLSDGQGGTVNNTVTIDVVAGTGQQGSLTAVGGTVTGTFYGVPGQQYYVQQTLSLSPASWTDLNGGSAYTADSNGLISFTDTPGQSSAFYRLSTNP